MNKFDVVIIGSGMGGLVCADLLSREGYKVCVLERNKQLGGCLQTYVRDKVIFDSGVHYLGGLDKGQNLYQIFQYLGIYDQLKLQRLDPDAFDKIVIEPSHKEYTYAQGYDNFMAKLVADFPDEEAAIRTYCARILEVCSRFPLYNMRTGGYNEKADVLEIDTKTYIESLTDNLTLQAVLAGNNALYAGQPNKTPFYVHALILNSYIESSWKCVDGGSQIARLLARNIRAQGGDIRTRAHVTKIVVEGKQVTCVELSDGTRVHGKEFISNMHPVKTLEITETDVIRPAYRNRLSSLENSISSFTLNIVLKPNTFKYFKYNYYVHQEGHAWTATDHTDDNWPLGYALFLSASSKINEYAEGMTVLAYMRYDEVQQWEKTFNTVTEENQRSTDYEAFKKYKAEILLDRVEQHFPDLRQCIKSYYTATPLSFRDYIGNDDGSLYGIVKDYRDPLKTFISPRTKVENLYFTGQNLNLHGILGAAMSGIVTCTALVGDDRFIHAIGGVE